MVQKCPEMLYISGSVLGKREMLRKMRLAKPIHCVYLEGKFNQLKKYTNEDLYTDLYTAHPELHRFANVGAEYIRITNNIPTREYIDDDVRNPDTASTIPMASPAPVTPNSKADDDELEYTFIKCEGYSEDHKHEYTKMDTKLS